MNVTWFTRLQHEVGSGRAEEKVGGRPRWAIRLGLLVLMLSAWAAQGEPARAQILADAIGGEPFGVGRVELRLPPDMLPEEMGLSGIGLTEKDGRVLYPAVEKRLLRTAIRDLLNRPQAAVIYFLFQGNAPLTLTVQSRVPQTFVLPPASTPEARRAILSEWWRAYNARPGLTERSADYPPLVENYLRASLAPRLGLPAVDHRSETPWQQQIQQELGIALTAEPILLAMERDRFQGNQGLAETADQPLPAPIPVPPWYCRLRWQASRSSRWRCGCRPSVCTCGSAASPTSSGSRTRWHSGAAICGTWSCCADWTSRPAGGSRANW